MDKSNVFDFMDHKRRRDYPIFAPDLRMKLEHEMRNYSEKPSAAITAAEQVICAHMVSGVRGWAWKFGELIGNRISDSLFRED